MDIIETLMNSKIVISDEGKAGDRVQNLMSAMGDRIPTGSNAIPDTLPQERVSGDVFHGYGPRRGNLERLLRYWRPIMRKEGGFRRCRVILADHPELYPLENICAWLHHETTGLWPNEGCHHPGMKNCRKKLKKGIRGSLWSDKDFDNRLRKLTSREGKKSLAFVGIESPDNTFSPVITEADWEHAYTVLSDFIAMEPAFVRHICDNNNWEHEHGYEVEKPRMVPLDEDSISF
jgi:hypothetical protein